MGMTMDQLEPAVLTGQVIPAEGGDPLGLYERSWTCMVCDAVRLYDDIHVAHRPYPGMEQWFRPADGSSPFAYTTVRHCRDRATCSAAAHGTGLWPEPLPVLQAGMRVRLTAAAVIDRLWDARDERVPSELTRDVVLHLRDTLGTTMQVLTDRHRDSGGPYFVFDAVRRLVQLGAVEAAPTGQTGAVEAAA